MDISDIYTGEKMKALVQEYQKYCKDNHLRCSNGCGTYNTIDKDCEIYGDYHPPISKCRRSFIRWVREKEESNEDII